MVLKLTPRVLDLTPAYIVKITLSGVLLMYVNTKLGVHVTPVGAVLWEHRAGVKSNTRGVIFNTTVFAV